MKNLLIPLLVVVALSSCHKKNSGSTGNSTNLSGLTGMRVSTIYDSGLYQFIKVVTWKFTDAQSLITAMPTEDYNYIGIQNLSFTGNKVTMLTSTGGQNRYNGYEMLISYNTANNIDSIIIFGNTLYTYPSQKMAFQYIGSNLTGITIGQANAISDTIAWASAIQYNYYYTGSNITMETMGFIGSPNAPDTFLYYLDKKKNNFSGATSSYLMFSLLKSIAANGLYFYDVPFYVNENLIDSSTEIYDPGHQRTTSFSYVLDGQSRVIQQTVNYFGQGTDTVLYY